MFELGAGQLSALVSAYFWPFIRIGAMLAAMPIFGSRTMPVRLRVVFAAVLTALLAPALPDPPAVDVLSGVGLLITLQQVLIGVAMGFVLHMVFSALQQAGEKIAMSMGLGFAFMVDPQNGINTPVVSQYYSILATLLFLALDGHLVAIDILAQSFALLPVGVEGISREALWQLALWGSFMYAGAVLIALPAVAAIMIVNVALGVITRAAPQLNIFAVGLPMTLMLGFVLMLVTLPSVLPQLTDLLGEAFTLMISLPQMGP
jgi:flagellar biosynthetic protein FliR